MKLLILALLSFSLVSCASRSPSSAETQELEEGINAEYYGSPSLN